MKVLAINGSPRGEKSNTLRITRAFLDGLQDAGVTDIQQLTLQQMNIKDCIGCFSCWKETPGRCVIKDDMEAVLEKLLQTDTVIWSFPLYYFSFPSRMKAFLDRHLPLNMPQIEQRSDGGSTHPGRHGHTNSNTILISSCGFPSVVNNYEALETQAALAFDKKSVHTIFCPQGELLSVPELGARTREYLQWTRKAGKEFAANKAISDLTQKALDTPLLDPETYIRLANASWGSGPGITSTAARRDDQDLDQDQKSSNAEKDPSQSFIIQMAALYNPRGLDGREALLEIEFTDLGKTWLLHLGPAECRVLKADEQRPQNLPLTTIKTPWPVWKDISAGTTNGAQAMMDGSYQVLGNFDLMLKMDGLFSGPETEGFNPDLSSPGSHSKAAESASGQKANMLFLLLPWLALWILLPISLPAGIMTAFGIVGIVQLAAWKYRPVWHERLALAATSLLWLAAYAGISTRMIIPLSYLIFGMHWIASCLSGTPLTACYSKDGYGGDSALENPLFIKTNAILTLIWGVAYILTAAGSWLLMAGPLASKIGIINSIIPLILGVWTAWFQRWYPAHVASRGCSRNNNPRKAG